MIEPTKICSRNFQRVLGVFTWATAPAMLAIASRTCDVCANCSCNSEHNHRSGVPAVPAAESIGMKGGGSARRAMWMFSSEAQEFQFRLDPIAVTARRQDPSAIALNNDFCQCFCSSIFY